MGHYTEGEKTFLERTFKIIEQYEKITENRYEVTLLINCLLGTVVLVNNKWLDELKKIELDDIKKEYEITIEKDKKTNEDLIQSLGDLIKSLRNGICHWSEESEGYAKELEGIKFSKNSKDGSISEITIQGTFNFQYSGTIKFKNSKELLNFCKMIKRYLDI